MGSVSGERLASKHNRKNNDHGPNHRDLLRGNASFLILNKR